MSMDSPDWECEKCKESPDRLNRVREKKYPWITRYVCDKCKEKFFGG